MFDAARGSAIAPAIAAAEQQRAMRKTPASLDAWAAYQRALWHWSKFNVDDIALAQKFVQQGIDLDPTFAGATAASLWLS
jgi:adenylate cyclase